MDLVYIEAFDIGDAWRKVIQACWEKGYQRPVFRGERKEELRRELDWLVLKIKVPSTRPLYPIIPPTMPKEFPTPSSEELINEYLETIATPFKGKNTTYTYGDRPLSEIEADRRVLEGAKLEKDIVEFMRAHDKQEGINIHFNFNQIDKIVQFLKETPETNRAIIEVGKDTDLLLSDPPCLRLIHFKIRHGKFNMKVIFRSWDAYAGLPVNLGGYQKLKESILSDLNKHYAEHDMPIIEDGEILASSLGCHIYSGQWKYVEMLLNPVKQQRLAEQMKDSFLGEQ